MRGFKDFIMQGNLVELAVAFVMGVAFTAVVTSLVDNIIMPIIGKFGGRPDFSSIEVADIPIGQFINDLVAFAIIAAAIYFLVVLPYNKSRERFAKPEEEAADEVTLLTEIRDVLTRASDTPSGGSHSA